MNTLILRLIVFLMVAVVTVDAFSQASSEPDVELPLSAGDSLSVAIMPFANNALDLRVGAVLETKVSGMLEKQGLAVKTAQDIRPILRKNRIRSRGWVGLKNAQMLREDEKA